MLINQDSYISSVVGMLDDAYSLDRCILKHGPSDDAFAGISSKGIRGTSIRNGVNLLYNRKFNDVLNSSSFCSYRPTYCGNCHEFSGCTNGNARDCQYGPGNPVCGHPEMSHFWIDMERLTVLHGIIHERLHEMSIHDVSMLRALIRTARMQDGKILHAYFGKGEYEKASRNEIVAQQAKILEIAQPLIYRVSLRTRELIGQKPMNKTLRKEAKQKILPDFYYHVTGDFPFTFRNLFSQG